MVRRANRSLPPLDGCRQARVKGLRVRHCISKKVPAMDAQFLHRFVARPSFFLNVCLIEGEPDTLGVLYKYIPADAPQHTYLTSFAILDIQQRISLASVTFNEHGPQHEP